MQKIKIEEIGIDWLVRNTDRITREHKESVAHIQNFFYECARLDPEAEEVNKKDI